MRTSRKKSHKILINSALCYIYFGLFSLNILAQDVKNKKFDDKDINNFVPVFETEVPDIETNNRKNGKLPESNSSSRAKFLTDSLAEANKVKKITEGYRIQVYSGSNKEEVNRVKENIYNILPEADLYSVYKQPIYRVRLGDYTDRMEATRILTNVIAKIYPNAIVVPDNVLIRRKY